MVHVVEKCIILYGACCRNMYYLGHCKHAHSSFEATYAYLVKA